MLERFRAAWARILTPIAAFLLRRGVGPDVVTWIGTAGVVITAAVCFPQGWLVVGSLIIGAFTFSDMVDGQMARLSGRTSPWGAFLDSSLDRVGDGAVFAGIALYFAGAGSSLAFAAVTLVALVMGQVTSYVKARAESVGLTVPGGLAARADRLLVILVAALLAGLGVPYVLEIAVVLLALATTWTVGQRVRAVHRATHPAP
jgi:CDP-diacylglycerol--glycerol-3-phosphate 3-phosphatidyltransferase